MKAKDLITGSHHLHEAEPPATGEDQLPPMGRPGGGPRRPFRMPGGRPGGPPGPPRMFGGPEESALKDIILLFLTEVAGNNYDGAIVRKLVAGKDLDKGELQHILDEGSRIENLPESHAKILEKIHQTLQRAPG